MATTFHIIPTEFVSWERDGIVPLGTEPARIDPDALNFPRGHLFLALLYLRDNEFDLAADFLMRALQTHDEWVRKHRSVAALLELCTDDGLDLLGSLSDVNVSRSLAEVLEAHTESKRKRPREAVAVEGAAASTDEHVEGHDHVRRVYHAAAVLRRRLLSHLSERGIPWKSASPLVVVQKLLFYADALSIAQSGAPLLGVPPIALPMGPVYDPAHAFLRSLHESRAPASWEPPPDMCVLTSDELKVLDRVFDRLVNLPAATLVDHSHDEKPWVDAKNRARVNHSRAEVIDLDNMCRWFAGDNSQVVRYLRSTDAAAELGAPSSASPETSSVGSV